MAAFITELQRWTWVRSIQGLGWVEFGRVGSYFVYFFWVGLDLNIKFQFVFLKMTVKRKHRLFHVVNK